MPVFTMTCGLSGFRLEEKCFTIMLSGPYPIGRDKARYVPKHQSCLRRQLSIAAADGSHA